MIIYLRLRFARVWALTRHSHVGACTKQTFKILRKTSPTLLEGNAAYAHVARHFLGHAPRSISDKHYVAPDRKTFDAAINWLGEQYKAGELVG